MNAETTDTRKADATDAANTTDTHKVNIRRSIIIYALLGFPLGIAIGTVILLIMSFFAGDGNLHPVTPFMLTWLPNELVAFFLQTVLCGILGSVCAGASPIFQIDRWSLARQTVTHFLLLSVTMITIASICGWAGRDGLSLLGTLSYAGIFVVIYLLIWASLSLYWRNWIKKANSRLS
jgi:hypothetical protein